MSASQWTLASGDGQYSQHSKKLLDLVTRLRATGAQADLDLPRIAVIGNQSAGKSSLVEAISGITVPRDAGTCTRCPMECRMSSSSSPWRCQIRIRWEFEPNGQRAARVTEMPFGGVIYDKKDVELMLRRAQAAVLNPKVPAEKFLQLSSEGLQNRATERALLFSKNAVCIDLSGPTLTDLSFVDLPGIIQNADDAIVRFVEELVLSQVEGNCLILVTLPMSDDIDNQKAARLARQVDPTGIRTIGVLTKPDTLLPGATKSRELWLEVLEGRSAHRLEHGYFCTRQPDDAERAVGITAAEARAAEAHFFATTSPWNRTTHQNRLGTEKLVDTLNELLTRLINDALPKLHKEVNQQFISCTTELAKLPPPVTKDPPSYVLSLITAFCQEVAAHVKGEHSATSLVQHNRQMFAQYKRRIRSTAPPFLPYPSIAEAPHTSLKLLELEDENEDESGDGTTTSMEIICSRDQCMYLQDMRRYIKQNVTRELPYNVPYSAKVALIQDFQKSWGTYSRDCFADVYKEFERTLQKLLQDKFVRFSHLLTRVRLAITELLQTRKDETLTYLDILLKLESTPFTQNDHYLSEKTAKSLARYKGARTGKRLPENVHFASAVSSSLPTHLDENVRDLTQGSATTTTAGTTTLNANAEGGKTAGKSIFGSSLPHDFSSFFPKVELAPPAVGTGSSPFFSIGAGPSSNAATSNAPARQVATNSRVSQTSSSSSISSSGSATSQGSASSGASSSKYRSRGLSKTSEILAERLKTQPLDAFGQPTTSTAFSGGFGSATASAPAPAPSTSPPPVGAADTWIGQSSNSQTARHADSPEDNTGKATSNIWWAKEQETEDRDAIQKEAIALLVKLGYVGVTVEDLGKLNPPDEFEEELQVMAEVRAYFQVAYKRVIDYVPLTIDHLFLYGLADTLQSFLIEKLGLGSAERCAAYLSEDPGVVAYRKELIGKRERLDTVQKELDNFGL
ncbi:hypothetical protein WOLCODRAFT_139118 [Wolfiporia cocos MD-104 SS10]|uniref:P-loop containing nucleoside triphosphate hydrolase protein n=1 Tax=Wolfiporia cocos (strain MD-104) TaxID=742152 RepID=A0A2H3K3B3_WOLCO|nr:hypothetical protein WOLCODRAFT_139118 [Wolfiporia cocos MD-104 SS10]